MAGFVGLIRHQGIEEKANVLVTVSLNERDLAGEHIINFSEKEPGSLGFYSPNGAYIATAVQLRLVVHDAQTLQVVALYDCADNIQQIAWSADSCYLLSASFKKACVEVWSVRDQEWSAKIEVGSEGLVGVRWAPDARTVLCFSEHQLRVTMWNLALEETSYIQYPKFSDKGLDFRSDNRYAALAERRDSKDFIGVYDCHDWSVVKHFASDTVDLDGLAWSPDGKYIAVWENVLDYKILIYTSDGRCLTSYSAYNDSLGVKFVAWSPSGQFLAVGSYDQKARLLNHYTWNPTMEFAHPSTLKSANLVSAFFLDDKRVKRIIANLDLAVRTELPVELFVFVKEHLVNTETDQFATDQIAEQPFTVLTVLPEADKPNPRIGVGYCEFSSDGKLFATRNDNMPNALWVWDVASLQLTTVIVQQQPVRVARWNPVLPDVLALCVGNGCIYLWSGHRLGAEVVKVPAGDFSVTNFQWSPDGKALLLIDKELFSVAYFVEGD